MFLFFLGMAIFLSMHSLGILAKAWRDRQVTRLGALGWKGIYSLISAIGFILMIVGFGQARDASYRLYAPPGWLHYLTILLTLAAFILIAAAYVPRNHLKQWLGHPMLAGVIAWAFGHLASIGMLRDVILFSSFLIWAIIDFVVSRRHDQIVGTIYPAGTLRGDLLSLVIGTTSWTVVAFWLHKLVIGLNPLG